MFEDIKVIGVLTVMRNVPYGNRFHFEQFSPLVTAKSKIVTIARMFDLIGLGTAYLTFR